MTMSDVMYLLGPSTGDRPVLLYSGLGPVASLIRTQQDYPWIEYVFIPLEGWKKLGSVTELFSARLTVKDFREQTNRIVQAIVDLDLWLQSEDGSVVVRDFLLRIRGDRASVRSLPRGRTLTQVRSDGEALG